MENNSPKSFLYAQIFLRNAHAAERERVEGQDIRQMRDPMGNLPIGAGR